MGLEDRVKIISQVKNKPVLTQQEEQFEPIELYQLKEIMCIPFAGILFGMILIIIEITVKRLGKRWNELHV